MTSEINGGFYDTPDDPRMGTGTTSGGTGTAVKYITDDSTATGNALLSSAVGVIAWINDKSNAYPCQGVLSSDLKTLTLGANKQGVSNTNVLINLIGGLTSVVTGINYTAVANGIVINYLILGKLA